MASPLVIDALESIIIAGVALTAEALGSVGDGIDLTLPMWRVLLVVGDAHDGATVSEVARRIRVTVPATSRQLQRMARHGLLTLHADERDRRAMRAVLTPTGQSVRTSVMQARRERLRVALAPLLVTVHTEHDLALMAQLLGTLR